MIIKREQWKHLVGLARASETEELASEVARGLDPNSENEDGFRLLHVAAELRDRRLTEMLLDRGADANARAFNSVTPLLIAGANLDWELGVLLSSRGAVDNLTCARVVQEACLEYAKIWAKVLSYRGEVSLGEWAANNSLTDLSRVRSDLGLTLLHSVVSMPAGRMSESMAKISLLVSRVLLELKVDHTLADIFGCTPADYARMKGMSHLVPILVEGRATIAERES